MARLPYLDRSDLLAEHQDLLSLNVNVYRLLAHSPRAARSINTLARFLRDGSRLDPRLREMAVLQIGYLLRSAYTFSHHIRIGRNFGVSDDDIRAVIAESAGRSSGLDKLAKTVLRAAREMTTGLAVAPDTFGSLREALGDECVTDLMITISFYNGLVRLEESLGIDVEDDYRGYLEEFPLPSG